MPCNATRAAVEEGIVPGGGVALLRAKAAVAKLKTDNPDVQAGINIVLKALEAPIRQIAENSGVEGSIVVGKINDNKSPDLRLQRADGRVCRHAHTPASSIRRRSCARPCRTQPRSPASSITTEAMVAELPKKEAGSGDAGRRRHGRHGLLRKSLKATIALNESQKPRSSSGAFLLPSFRGRNPTVIPGPRSGAGTHHRQHFRKERRSAAGCGNASVYGFRARAFGAPRNDSTVCDRWRFRRDRGCVT